MKIVVDENMPYVQPLFGELGEIITVNGRSLTAEIVSDADVLLVRSVTKVNADLLQNATRLKFVGSATIGTDHIDLDYLKKRQIPFFNAPGCNAIAVGEFAFIAMLELANRFDDCLKNKTVGIVGAGNTGSALARCLDAYGVNYLLCDPFIEKHHPDQQWATFAELVSAADVISLHVPLTHSGEHPTWHLFDENQLQNLKQNTWLLNCCRGEVVDNQALIKIKQQRNDIKLVLDVWENEPTPLLSLIDLTEFVTPHIAGYTLEGKARGTFFLYQKLMHQLNKPISISLTDLLPVRWNPELTIAQMPDEISLLKLCRFIYDLRDDDQLFRKIIQKPAGFDNMRKNHTSRREFSALTLSNECGFKVNWLFDLGFSGDNE